MNREKAKLLGIRGTWTGVPEEAIEQDKAKHGPGNSRDSKNPGPLFKDVGI